MKKGDDGYKLKERVKELRCLYELSRVAWQADSNVNALIRKTLEIIPQAMQFPALAEVKITLDKEVQTTSGFVKCKTKVAAVLTSGNIRYGTITIGYRNPSKNTQELRPNFLAEEKKLLKIIAREISLYLKRASVEEEKKQLELQLQHAERLAFVGKLSAGIAHEINEPLGRVLGFAQLIKKQGLSSVQQLDDLEKIIKASLYAREIIKKLMFFSRQMPMQLVPVNINDSIENILTFIDMRYQSKSVKIISRLESNLPTITADPVQISQVIVNLLTNAIYAMPKGGTVVVTTERKQGYIKLIVCDNGSGMTPEVQRKIFEPFFTTKPVGHGTGLGLSVVHGIVLDHGGSIRVNSKVGKGTDFEVRFPVKVNRKKR